MSARDRILAAVKREEIEIPEWGRVHIQALTARQRVEVGRMINNDDPDVSLKVAAWSLVDENGARLFTDEERELLANVSGQALEEAVKACWQLSGLLKGDEDELEGKVAVDSEPSPSDDSPSV